ncbi:unnamed protein product [Sphenostylis stenocarpa]|uniref:ATP-dependent Clp protease proteolytic subunit n=1 Tax=Sphenostylis stenocarpa TaxID=92480 RepID=A0AA86VDZ0_9FABA|nr:unnamed protein product [Sphenostylis stenocarpa]
MTFFRCRPFSSLTQWLTLTMEVATTASSFALNKPMLALPSSSRIVTPIRAMSSSTSSVRTSLSTNFVAPCAGISSAYSHFSGHKLRPSSLNPASFRGSNAKRGVVTMGGEKLGYETEAFAIYDVMRYVKPPIFTLCVGNAWGEAALLLASGAKGNRSALPSSTIMIRQPIARFQGQATDVNLARREVNNVKTELVKLYAKHMEKSPEQIEADIQRPKYFSPREAVEYGIIDKVIYNDRGSEDRGVVSDLKKARLI